VPHSAMLSVTREWRADYVPAARRLAAATASRVAVQDEGVGEALPAARGGVVCDALPGSHCPGAPPRWPHPPSALPALPAAEL
jgi:hypothetical protein